MALAVNHLPATMAFSSTMVLGSTMAVTTAGATSPIVGTLPAMRAEETWHAFCYLSVNRRKLLSINHLGARRARKSFILNTLQLGTILEYLRA